MSNETKRTHTQDVDPYFGSDLTTGMIWVSGYGHHYLITEVKTAQIVEIVGGYLNWSTDFTHVTLTLRPAGREPSFQVTVDTADEFDILRTN